MLWLLATLYSFAIGHMMIHYIENDGPFIITDELFKIRVLDVPLFVICFIFAPIMIFLATFVLMAVLVMMATDKIQRNGNWVLFDLSTLLSKKKKD